MSRPSALTCSWVRTPRLPISMKRPRNAVARKLESMKDPLNELSTTSTPLPWVSRDTSVSNVSSREIEDVMHA